jgi:hypothetical protein
MGALAALAGFARSSSFAECERQGIALLLCDGHFWLHWLRSSSKR